MNHLKQNSFHAIGYISSLNSCYVCGSNHSNDIIHGEICPCCFTEWGVDEHQQLDIDGTLTDLNSFIKSVQLLRSEWLGHGAEFNDEDFKPEGWNREMAIKQIKDNVPEELWKDDPLLK